MSALAPINKLRGLRSKLPGFDLSQGQGGADALLPYTFTFNGVPFTFGGVAFTYGAP